MNTDIQFKLHFNQTISQSEIVITNQLARSLTELNLKRIEQAHSLGLDSKKGSLSDKRNYLYVCITGLPAFKQEFEGIGIPGEKIIVYPACYQPGFTEEQSKSQLHLSQLQTQAALLHEKIKDRTDKHIVLVFHSFGTAIVSTFCRIYHSDYINRIIGIIPIGAYPVRGDQYFINYILWAQSLTKEEIYEKGGQYFQTETERLRGNNIVPSPNKYAYMSSLIAFGHGLGFDEMFSYIRRWFPVLKCFIYGRQDNRLTQNSLNQSAIYYCYKRKISPQYETKAQVFLKERYNLHVDNVQERFIFNIDGGKHSIHMQRRFKPLLSQIINEYLTVLEDTIPSKC